ncbi:MAG: hypothetical protein NTY38_07095, partial [Acidobacteria bacterium]|nr:hypothetical protein [Acidobacteriota bacterium]
MMNLLQPQILFLVLAAGALAEPRILINGKAYSPEAGEFSLDAGRMNELVVEGAEGAVRLSRQTAAGVTLSESKTADGGGRARFRLGPMAAAAAYDYEAGALYVRGYTISLEYGGRSLQFQQAAPPRLTATHPYPWWHLEEMTVRPLRFASGGAARWLFDLTSASPGPVSLRLAEKVLEDQDQLELEVRLNRGETPAELPVLLRVTSPAGTEVWSQRAVLLSSASWTHVAVDPRSWSAGAYRVEVLPILGDTTWKDGPAVTYQRRNIRRTELKVSPLAPWTLERDPAREEIVIRDFRQAHQRWGVGAVPEGKYAWREGKAGEVALEGKGDAEAPPV